jgi:uncharacterized delta-60 repeat protein
MCTGNGQAEAMAIQDDGKIIAVGSSDNGAISVFAIARYTTNGLLDTTFGTGGKVITEVGPSSSYAKAVSIQSDGKIVVAGYTDNINLSNFAGLALVRYNITGELDHSFGINGIVLSSVGNNANSLAIQSDGKIIITGSSSDNVQSNFITVRFNSNGSIDPSFGNNGIVVASFDGSSHADAIAIQKDGKIIVGGLTGNSPNFNFTLVRYNCNGDLDTLFGMNGKVIITVGNFYNSGCNSIKIKSDGKIIASGWAFDGAVQNYIIAQFDANGLLDVNFGTGGIINAYVGDAAVANDIEIQKNGKIVVAANIISSTNNDFIVARYDSTGILDSTFGINGNAITHVGIDAKINALSIQLDGKIVVAGSALFIAYNDTKYTFVLARYQGEPIEVFHLKQGDFFKLYPNPATHCVKIVISENSPVEISEIEMYNMKGQLIKRLYGNGLETIIDIDNIADGGYFLKVKTNFGIEIKKFVKD